MASILNASNSGSGGLIATGDASGVLALQSAGTTALTINTSQNVGIGTTSPSTKLHVSGGRSSFVANSDAYALSVGYASLGAYYLGANSSNNALIFSNSGGSEVVRFDSSGNVGIGTSSPAAKLNVTGHLSNIGATFDKGATTQYGINYKNSAQTYTQYVDINNNGTNYWTLYDTTNAQIITQYVPGASGSNAFYTAGTERMRIDSSGNLLIGRTSSDGYRVAALGSTQLLSGYQLTYSGVAAGSLTLTSGGAMAFGLDAATGSTERMRIDASGNVLVGTTSAYASSRLRVKSSGTSNATYNTELENSAGTILMAVRDDGYFFTGQAAVSPYNVTTGSAANCYINSDGGLYRSTSSARYKTDITDATHGLAEVLKLRPVTYKGKGEVDADKVFGGLIAEEVDDAGLSEFVVYRDDGAPDALNYGNMVALAFKAIQEQQALIESLTTRLTALEAK